MSKNLIKEARKMQKIAGLLKENEGQFTATLNEENAAIEIYNDGNHRLLLIFDVPTGRVGIVGGFYGGGWDAVWTSPDLRPKLLAAIKGQ